MPKTLTLTRYLTNFLIWTYHVIKTVFRQYLAMHRGAILPDVMWVIRNQRSKIHRLELVSTVRTPSRKILKIDCRVI